MKKTRESPKFPAFFVQTHIVCLGGSGHDIQTRLQMLSGKIVRIFLRHTPFLGLCGFLFIIGLLSASTVCATGVAIERYPQLAEKTLYRLPLHAHPSRTLGLAMNQYKKAPSGKISSALNTTSSRHMHIISTLGNRMFPLARS